MPQLMQSHHLIVGKAGGATVQEAIAARCPMIVNQVIPGQEEGNARLIEQFNLGAVAGSRREVCEVVEEAFSKKAALWRTWRDNLAKISRPDASLRLAEVILAECDWNDPARKPIKLFDHAGSRVMQPAAKSGVGGDNKMLLCDFHIHTNYSDGRLSLPDVIDFYGRRGFDCICITDHLADPRRLIGKLAEKVARQTLVEIDRAQIEQPMAFTRDDAYAPIPGYKTLVNHFHLQYVDRQRASGSSIGNSPRP